MLRKIILSALLLSATNLVCMEDGNRYAKTEKVMNMEANAPKQINLPKIRWSSLDDLSSDIILQILEHYLIDAPRLLVAFQRLAAFGQINKQFNKLTFSQNIQRILEKKLKHKLNFDISVLPKVFRTESLKLINFILGIEGFNFDFRFYFNTNYRETDTLKFLISNGHIELLEKLARNKSNNKIFEHINQMDSRGNDAFCYAREKGFKNIEKLLEENGADKERFGGDVSKIYSPLHLAVLAKDVDQIKLLLSSNASQVNDLDDGYTALQFAAKLGYFEIAKILLENGAKPDIKNYRDSALIEATKNGNFRIVELLLINGANVDRIEVLCDYTSLLFAVKHRYSDIVDLLIKYKANINATSYAGDSTLMLAVRNGDEDMVKLLIKNGAKVNLSNTKGSTALTLAAQFGHFAIAKYLLENGASIDAKIMDGWTSLMYASYYNHPEIVKLLLLKGAGIDLSENSGWTALMWAIQAGLYNVAECLINGKANVNTRDAQGFTALMFAAEKGHFDIVQLLIKNGAAINDVNTTGHSVLMNAAQYGHYDVTKLLIENKADVNIATKLSGTTALMLAACYGHYKTAELLINFGANIDAALTNTGGTALMLAVQDGHIDSVRVLLRYKANLNIKNKLGQTALDIAVEKNHHEIADILKLAMQTAKLN